MTVDIIGAGGIGCALGYALVRAGVPIRIIECHLVKVEAGRREGLRVGELPALPVEFAPFAEYEYQPGSVVLLCVKCYDNPIVLEKLPPDAILIPVQNGFDPLLDAHGHEFEGIASFVSECEPDRPHTRITRSGALHLGPRRSANIAHPQVLDELTEALRRGGLFEVHRVDDVYPFKFTKLMYNAAIAPLAAAAGLDNGDLLTLAPARRLFFALIRENYAILSGARIQLGKVGPFHPATVDRILRRRWLARMMAFAFAPSLRGTYCSMAHDLPGSRTEIDFYNGHLIRLANGSLCPLNHAVVHLIHEMERHGTAPNRDILKQLDA